MKNNHIINDLLAEVEELAASNGNVLESTKPRFPLHAFPEIIQYIVKQLHQANGLSIDFMGLGVIIATANAIGNTYQIQIKNNWVEIASIFGVLVGDSSTKKTPSIKNFSLKPAFQLQNKLKEQYKEDLQAWEQAKAQAKAEKKKFDDPMPVFKEIYLSDFTFECIVPAHLTNLKGLAIYKDELASWFRTFNQYRKGADQQNWLSIYSGSPCKVNRRSNPAPLILDKPCISIIGGTQTGVLHELAGENRDTDGFMFRLLYAFPDPIEHEEWTDVEIDTDLINQYYKILERLYEISYSEEKGSNMLHFGSSKPLWVEFYNGIKREVKKEQKKGNDIKISMLEKLIQQTARLALIMEMLLYACNESGAHEISPNAMRSAIELAKYFKFTSEYAYQIAKQKAEEAESKKVHKGIYKVNWSEIFGTDVMLKSQEIIARLIKKYGMSEPTANRYIREELVKAKYGFYTLMTVQ